MTRRDNDINHPSSPTSLAMSSTSPTSASLLTTSRLQQVDPYEFPDQVWTSPSNFPGEHPPETSEDQLDWLYGCHHEPHLQQTLLSSATTPHPIAYLPAVALASGSSSRTPTSFSFRYGGVAVVLQQQQWFLDNSSNLQNIRRDQERTKRVNPIALPPDSPSTTTTTTSTIITPVSLSSSLSTDFHTSLHY